MPEQQLSRAKLKIVQAYETVRQVQGDGTMVKQVVNFLGLKLDLHGDNSWVRRVLKEYKSTMR